MSRVHIVLISTLFPALRRLDAESRRALYRDVMSRTHDTWITSRNFFLCCASSFLALLAASAALRNIVPELVLPLFAFPFACTAWFVVKATFYRPIFRQAVKERLEVTAGSKTQATRYSSKR